MQLPSDPTQMTDEFLNAVEREAAKPGSVFSGRLVKVLVDQIRAEWADIASLSDNVSHVYDHVTGGMVSKPNTVSRDVIAMADEYIAKVVEGVNQLIGELSPQWVVEDE